ncbi:MAG TPA: hypothetical protein VGG64_04875 [Pirellulales bacterium]|jgi:hypothetical protein
MPSLAQRKKRRFIRSRVTQLEGGPTPHLQDHTANVQKGSHGLTALEIEAIHEALARTNPWWRGSLTQLHLKAIQDECAQLSPSEAALIRVALREIPSACLTVKRVEGDWLEPLWRFFSNLSGSGTDVIPSRTVGDLLVEFDILKHCANVDTSEERFAALHAAGDRNGLILAVMPRLKGWVKEAAKIPLKKKPELFGALVSHSLLPLTVAAGTVIAETMNDGAHVWRYLRRAVERSVYDFFNFLRPPNRPDVRTCQKRIEALKDGNEPRPASDIRPDDMSPTVKDDYNGCKPWEQGSRIDYCSEKNADLFVDTSTDYREKRWWLSQKVTEAAQLLARDNVAVAIDHFLKKGCWTETAAHLNMPESTLRDHIKKLAPDIERYLAENDSYAVARLRNYCQMTTASQKRPAAKQTPKSSKRSVNGRSQTSLEKSALTSVKIGKGRISYMAGSGNTSRTGKMARAGNTGSKATASKNQQPTKLPAGSRQDGASGIPKPKFRGVPLPSAVVPSDAI